LLRPSLVASLILIILLACPAPGFGAVLTVSDFGDSGAPGQLRTLINTAAPGDTVMIPAGTITLTGVAGEDANAGGDLDVLKGLTIQGAGPSVTIIDGGGIDRVFHIIGDVAVTVRDLTITGGSTGVAMSESDRGGGIFNEGGRLSVVNCDVSANSTIEFGGGIANLGGVLTVTNSTLTNNNADLDSGGIDNEEGDLTITASTLSGNMASGAGGGILNFGASAMTIVSSVFSGNLAGSGGGAIASFSDTLSRLTNVTISGNSTVEFGGGIGNVTGPLVLTNVTLSGNTALGEDGGAIDNSDPESSVQLKNTIVAGDSGINCSGVLASLGHNLSSDASCGFSGPGDLNNTNPLLGPLQDNGGPTKSHALLSGSPAIDAGDNAGSPSTDQRGVLRPQDGNSDGNAVVDIGAYEVVGSGPPHTLTITPPGPSGTPNPVASSGTASLSVAATDTLPHTLTYAWTADCPAALVGDGSFNNAALQTPTWTAPVNTTGSQQNCSIQVTVSDGAVPDPKSQSPAFSQGVSPEGVGPSEPTVPQLLNLKTFDGADSEQQTFLPTDPLHVAATYYDPNPVCAGVAPVLLQLLAFNLEGQLLVTREDVTSAPIAPGSKYRLLSANLAPGDLVPGAYTLIFLVRDCTNVNIFVSGFYPILVFTP